MDGGQPRPGSRVTRRDVLRLGVGTVGAAMLGAAGCAPNADKAKGGGGGGGALVLLSTQLRPEEEAKKIRQKILADYGGKVDFLGEDAGPFHDRIEAEARAGKGSVGGIGGEHGDMAALAKLGGDKPLYIPWMQASYIMVARKEALALASAGLDTRQGVTYEQVTDWAKAIADKEKSKRSACRWPTTAWSTASCRGSPTRATPAG